jgi:small subunit ribosomal protein S9
MMQQTVEREKKADAPQQVAQEQPQAQKKKVARKKAPAKSKERVVVTKSKRKEAVARAYLKAGKGTIRINSIDISAVENHLFRSIATEPLSLFDSAKQISQKLGIKVIVYGGGHSAQAYAARGAIAKGIVEYSGSAELKAAYQNYDRSLLIDDPRRVEPKKYKGPKARARFQKSYR